MSAFCAYCPIILGFVCMLILDSCNCDCDPLPYREEIKALCRFPTQDVQDCYYTKFPTASSAIYTCEDEYSATDKDMKQSDKKMKCDKNGFWSDHSTFQMFECKKEYVTPGVEVSDDESEQSTRPTRSGFVTSKPYIPRPSVLEDVRSETLKLHNKYRKRHSAPMLKLDQELNDEAQSYAQLLIRRNVFVNQHQSNKKFLKNIFELDETVVFKEAIAVGTQAVNEWYFKVDEYDKYNPHPSTFTQIVWKSTKLIGVGMSFSENQSRNERRTVLVVTYSPPGNINGAEGKYFRENVHV